jgi:predicted GIY-YIG superfamily endonuclease
MGMNDVPRRVFEHKAKAIKGFTSKCDVTRLVRTRLLTGLPVPLIERESSRNGAGIGKSG